jgi:hypothetical protein
VEKEKRRAREVREVREKPEEPDVNHEGVLVNEEILVNLAGPFAEVRVVAP